MRVVPRRSKGSRFVVVVAAVVAVTTALPSTAGAEPLRSGTIVGGFFTFGPSSDCRSETVQRWCPGCQLAPDCLAWLESGCNAAPTGIDVAWLTSIEDVAELADGGTPRVFSYGTPAGLTWGGVMVQFWRADCVEIRRDRRPTHSCGGAPAYNPCWERPVPSSAKWMTVVSNGSLNVAWTLR